MHIYRISFIQCARHVVVGTGTQYHFCIRLRRKRIMRPFYVIPICVVYLNRWRNFLRKSGFLGSPCGTISLVLVKGFSFRSRNIIQSCKVYSSPLSLCTSLMLRLLVSKPGPASSITMLWFGQFSAYASEDWLQAFTRSTLVCLLHPITFCGSESRQCWWVFKAMLTDLSIFRFRL